MEVGWTIRSPANGAYQNLFCTSWWILFSIDGEFMFYLLLNCLKLSMFYTPPRYFSVWIFRTEVTTWPSFVHLFPINKEHFSKAKQLNWWCSGELLSWSWSHGKILNQSIVIESCLTEEQCSAGRVVRAVIDRSCGSSENSASITGWIQACCTLLSRYVHSLNP